MDDVVGAGEQGGVGGGLEDVGALPGDLVGPRGRVGGRGDGRPFWLARAAFCKEKELVGVYCNIKKDMHT